MKIKKRQEGEVMVLDLSGKIMGGDDFDLFNNAIHDLVKDGYVDIVLNLKGVKWINSTGLGLMVTRKLIEEHNGTIDVESEPGKGTRITVRIPYNLIKTGD